MPKLLVESFNPAVQMVGRIVPCQLVCFAIERESGARNAARHAARDGAEIRMAAEVRVEVVESQHHIACDSVTAGREQARHNAAVRDGFELEAAAASERPRLHRLTGGQHSKCPRAYWGSHRAKPVQLPSYRSLAALSTIPRAGTTGVQVHRF